VSWLNALYVRVSVHPPVVLVNCAGGIGGADREACAGRAVLHGVGHVQANMPGGMGLVAQRRDDGAIMIIFR